jgi:hypothetical protein
MADEYEDVGPVVRPDQLDLSHLESKEEEPTKARSGQVVQEGEVGKDWLTQKDSSHKGKSVLQVSSSLFEASKATSPYVGVKPRGGSNMIRLKSNSLRGRNEIFEGMVMSFDGDGIAKIPDHHLAKIQQLQRLRPNRFTILENAVLQEAPVPVAVKQEVATAMPETKQAEPVTMDTSIFSSLDDEEVDFIDFEEEQSKTKVKPPVKKGAVVKQKS